MRSLKEGDFLEVVIALIVIYGAAMLAMILFVVWGQ